MENNSIKMNEFGDPVDEFGDPIKTNTTDNSFVGGIVEKAKDLLSKYGQNPEGLGDIAKTEPAVTEGALKYGPGVTSAIATGFLGPEASYPTYAAVGGLSQGLSRMLANKLQGKDMLNKDTAIDTGLGLAGGAIAKPLGQLGNYIGKSLASSTLKGTPEALELAKGTLKGDKFIGPELQKFIENSAQNSKIDAAAVGNSMKPGQELGNLFNKAPENIFKQDATNEAMAKLQKDALQMMQDVEPYGDAGKKALGDTSNILSQLLIKNTGENAYNGALSLNDKMRNKLLGK